MADLPLLYLLTPQHTGTHFTRMLLESHSGIDLCVNESRRVHRQRLLSYRLHGKGDGSGGPDQEVLLDHFAHAFLEGTLSRSEFLGWIAYATSLHAELYGRRVYDQLAFVHRNDFNRLGIQPLAKRPRFALFHGHSGPKHLKVDFSKVDARLIVTLRHPLLAVTSALRRTGDDRVAENILTAFELLLRIPHAILVCVDLWQTSPDKFLEVFETLGLSPEIATCTYVRMVPTINETITRSAPPPTPFQQRESNSISDAMRDQLRAARDLWLREGRVAPILRPWLDRIRRMDACSPLRKLGYDL